MPNLFKPTDTLEFGAFFTANLVGKTGLTVTVNVNGPSGNLITAAAATEVDPVHQPGLYSYSYTHTGSLASGLYYADFNTTDLTVDIQQLIDTVEVQAWVAFIDVSISSRAIAGSVTIISPVSNSVNLNLDQNADYYNVDGTAIYYALTAPYSLAGASASLEFAGLSIAGVIVDASNMYFEIPRATIATLTPGPYPYELEVKLANGHYVIPVRGKVYVSVNL